MHQSALRLRSRYQSSLHWYFCNIHCRRLSTAGPVPVVNSDQQALNALEPWKYSGGKHAKDVNIDDLSATLEAHRASNRAAVIRKVELDANEIRRHYKRPVLEQDSDGRSEVKNTHEEKEDETHQMWPADSLQAKEKYGKTGCRGFVKKNDPLEYSGTVQWLKEPWIIPKNCKYMQMQLQRPWLAYIETMGEDALERLTSEIKAYEAYMRLSPREEAASELVVSNVNSVARNQPEIKPLTLLGSRSTGLASPISDFDFSFTMPVSLPGGWIIPPSEDSVSQPQPLKLEKRRKVLQALRKMKRHFDSSKKFSGTELIQHARVPIIRSKHIATGLDIQIQTMAPYQAAHEYTIAYLSEFPSLRPLYIILRYCLELRDLTTVFKGGLGSYSILMMIVTAMKHSSGKFASDDLGSQLLHVLEFYGEADLYKVGFSANPPRSFEKQKERWSLEERMARMSDPQLSGIDQMQTFYPRKPYLLCLQDPANDLNDLGKNAYAIKHIQATFRHAKDTIQTALESNDEESDDRARGKIWSCLDQVVRADYRAFELHRSRTEQCTSRRKLNDGDHSEEMILRKFEERVNRYKGVVDEDDDLPETVLEAVDGNAAKSIEAEYSSNGSEGSADNIVAWYQQKLVRRRQNVIRSNFRQAKKAASKKATENLQKLHGTNDDERGWKTASASDQKTLLETPPESGLPNLFRKLESNAPLLRSHAVASWTRTVGRGMEISSTPTTAAKSPETGPQYLSQKSDVVRVRRLDTDVVEGRTRATERRRKASSPPTNAALFSRRARRPLVRNFNSKHKEASSPPPPSPSSAITEIRKVAVTLPENLSLDQLRNYEAGQDSWARIAARKMHGREVKQQRGKGSRRRRSSVIKTVKTSTVTKRYIDAFKLRRTLLPTLHKRVLVSEDMTKRLESDGAILPRSRRDPKGIPAGS